MMAEPTTRERELIMLVKRMSRSLHKVDKDATLADAADRFLSSNGLVSAGDILRDNTELAAVIATIPYKALAAELARRNSSRRRIKSGGRPKVLKPCAKCGALLGARERAKHHCSG